MGSIETYQYSPLVEHDSIRLFRLFPSSDPNADIRGEIIHTTLAIESKHSDHYATLGLYPSEAPDYICGFTSQPDECFSLEKGYTALSYTWGNPEKQSSVFIHGKRLGITRNLDQALRDLRLQTATPQLWIDSICIDQQSDHERNHQVRQMCQIYKVAASTIIYLGAATSLSTSCLTAAAEGPIEDSELAHGGYRPEDFPQLKKGRDEILSRLWFTRAWTFQELVVSRRPWVCCGNVCIPWSQLCSYILQTRRWEIAIGSDPHSRENMFSNNWIPDPWGLDEAVNGRYSIVSHENTQRLQITTKGVRTMDKVRQIYQAGPKTSIYPQEIHTLFSLIGHRQGFQATDPRDSIFSLYGIVEEDDQIVQSIPVDYSKSIVEVFADLAAAIISAIPSDLYSMFVDVENGRHAMKGLPSWVPNWSSRRMYDQSIRSHIIDYRYSISDTAQSVDCGVYKDLKTLVCRGRTFGQIVMLSEPLQRDEEWIQDWNQGTRIITTGDTTLGIEFGPSSNDDHRLNYRTSDGLERLLLDRADCLWGRQIAKLRSGGYALVSRRAIVGDLICILLGANVFYTIRKVVDGDGSSQNRVSLNQKISKDFKSRVSRVAHSTLIGEAWAKKSEIMAGTCDTAFAIH